MIEKIIKNMQKNSIILYVDDIDGVKTAVEDNFKKHIINDMKIVYDGFLVEKEGNNILDNVERVAKKLADKILDLLNKKYEIVHLVMDYRLGGVQNEQNISATDILLKMFSNNMISEMIENKKLITTIVSRYVNLSKKEVLKSISEKVDKTIASNIDKIAFKYLPVREKSIDGEKKAEWVFDTNKASNGLCELGNYIYDMRRNKEIPDKNIIINIEDWCFSYDACENFWGYIFARILIDPDEKIWRE